MNTLEYLAAVKQRLGVDSDYAVSKALGVTRQTVSRYMKGIGHFDEPVCRRVAEILGKHPGIVMLDMQRERAKNPEDRAVWSTILEKFSLGFEVLLSGVGPRRMRIPVR